MISLPSPESQKREPAKSQNRKGAKKQRQILNFIRKNNNDRITARRLAMWRKYFSYLYISVRHTAATRETLCGIVARLRVFEAAIRGINILVLAVFRTNFSGYFFSVSFLENIFPTNKPYEIFGSFLPSQKILIVKSGRSFFGVLNIDTTTKPSEGSIFTLVTLKLRNRQMDNDCHSS